MSRVPLPQPTISVPRSRNLVAEFLTEHHDWAGRFPSGELVYAIPEVALGSLARPTSSHPPARFDRATVDVERAFARLCRGLNAVGVWGTTPVSFPLLRPPVPPPDTAAMRARGWSVAQMAAIGGLVDQTTGANQRLVGVAGWLMTEPTFLHAVGDLRTRWEALPPFLRPRFPLDRGCVSADDAATPRVRVVEEFVAAFEPVLDRWGLTGFATWDLPVPQGPLLPNPLPASSPAHPRHGVHLFVPIHYPLQGDDDLLRRVRDEQRAQAADLGIDLSFGGLAHPETHAYLVRLQHLERAIRARFPGHRPRGLIDHIEEAAAVVLSLSTDRVRRLRIDLAACRRGHRTRVFRRPPR